MNKKEVYTKEELANCDMDVIIAKGILWAYGIVKFDEFFSMCKKYNKSLNKKRLTGIINKDKTISKEFAIKDVYIYGQRNEYVIYKDLSDEKIEMLILADNLKKKKFKKEVILTYSKYKININDKRIDELINCLDVYLDEKCLEKIMKRVFENLNYDDDIESTEALLFDEVVNSKTSKINGEKYVKIRQKLLDVLQNCSSWRGRGHNLTETEKKLKEIEINDIFSELEREMYEDLEQYELEEYDISDADLPF